MQGWMTDLNMLLSCFREKMSAYLPSFLGSEVICSHATSTEFDPLLLFSLRDPRPGRRTVGAKKSACQQSSRSADEV